MSNAQLTSGRLRAICGALTLFVIPAYSQTAGQLGFVHLGAIECSSTEPHDYRNWCEITGFSWVSSNHPSSETEGRAVEGRASKNVSIGDANLTKLLDRASPKIFEYVATGEHIKEVVIVFLDGATRSELLKITLSDVILSSVNYYGASPVAQFEEAAREEEGVTGLWLTTIWTVY